MLPRTQTAVWSTCLKPTSSPKPPQTSRSRARTGWLRTAAVAGGGGSGGADRAVADVAAASPSCLPRLQAASVFAAKKD